MSIDINSFAPHFAHLYGERFEQWAKSTGVQVHDGVALETRNVFRTKSGFDAVLLVTPDGTQAILAIAGTNELRDWFHNLFNFGTRQYLDAWPEIEAALLELGATNLLITGHSLGGALAQYIGLGIEADPTLAGMLNVTGRTYNALGADPGRKELVRDGHWGQELLGQTLSGDWAHYFDRFDLVSKLGAHVGGMALEYYGSGWNFVARHAEPLAENLASAVEVIHQPLQQNVATAVIATLDAARALINDPTREGLGDFVAQALSVGPAGIGTGLLVASALTEGGILTAGHGMSLAIGFGRLLADPFTETPPELQAQIDAALSRAQDQANELASDISEAFVVQSVVLADGPLNKIVLDTVLTTALNTGSELVHGVLNISAIEGIREGRGLLYDVTGSIWSGMGLAGESLAEELLSNGLKATARVISTSLRTAVLEAIIDEYLEFLPAEVIEIAGGLNPQDALTVLRDLPSGFGADFSTPYLEAANGVATWLGGKVGTALAENWVGIDSLDGALGFAFGASAGAAIATSFLTASAGPIGFFLAAAGGSAIGATVGEFLFDHLLKEWFGINVGAFFNNVFGDNGRFIYTRSYEIRYALDTDDDGTDRVVQADQWWKDVPGEVATLLDQVANSYTSTMNGVIELLGGDVELDHSHRVAGFAFTTDQGFGVTLRGRDWTVLERQTDPIFVLNVALDYDIRRLTIQTENTFDLVTWRAFEDWKALATADSSGQDGAVERVADLLYRLQVAQTYKEYLDDPSEANAILSAYPDSALAAEILSSLYNVVALGLDAGAAYDGGTTSEAIVMADGDDTVGAGTGNDTIFGHGGNDLLDGGEGDDVIYMGTGEDTVVGSGGEDVAVFLDSRQQYSAELITSANGAVEGVRINSKGLSQEGDNHLFGIETYRFADGDFTLEQLFPDDGLKITVVDDEIREGGWTWVRLERQLAGGELRVDWSVGDATGAALFDHATNGIIRLAPGQQAAQILLQPRDDRLYLPDGAFQLNVEVPEASVLKVFDFVVLDNDEPRALKASNDEYAYSFFGSEGVFLFEVARSGPVDFLEHVHWSVTPVTASAEEFFELRSEDNDSAIRFNPGRVEKTWAIALVDDDEFEGTESFILSLYSDQAPGVRYEQLVFIQSDDEPELGWHSSEYVLEGTDGADSLSDVLEHRILRGMAGNDWMIDNGTAVVFNGGPGFDTVSYANADGAIAVDLGTGRGTEGIAAGDFFVRVEAVVGSRHSDTLTGGGLNDSLIGNAGDDVLIGGYGDDLLVGDDTSAAEIAEMLAAYG